jgi:phosphatidylserine/phosphatidylglycerophosphate/cardiolipin synthase-like enzyme
MRRVLTQGRNYWCNVPVATAGLLIDGDDYFREFYRAALEAKHYILRAGWQFDSDACLLRGPEAEGAPLPVALKPFLSQLCDRTDSLRIYMLAWDYHTVFALEREWMQEQLFNWTTNDHLTFRFDSHHVDNGAHHHKFAVIDGELSFLGGLDLCDHRWDDRDHRQPNPLRVSRGEPHKPFHDVQAYAQSRELARSLERLFVTRWQLAGGKEFSLPSTPDRKTLYQPENGVKLAAERVVLSRTDPYGSPDESRNCREILHLYQDAIAAAEKLIYIETQYLTSAELSHALVERLKSAAKPLELVIVLNMEAETFKEQVAVGLTQAKVIGDLKEAVQGTPHRLGVYYTVPHTEDGQEPDRATYIHSKIMFVDDRFMTVGSANLTNRSAVVDTELNLSVEAESHESPLGKSLFEARMGLLCEHLGVERVEHGESLVAALDEHATRHDGRLRLHPSPTEKERAALELFDPQRLPFDPDSYEDDEETRGIFAGGLGSLWIRLMGKSSMPRSSAAD